jgi:two-component system, NarL family, sensor histidine kinase BarA
MTKIFDIQKSIISANGNVSLAKELFTMLLADLDVRLKQIEDSFLSENKESLAEHIHKLYGATAYCIVPKLRKSAEVLEHELRHKDYSKLEERVESIRHEINQLLIDGPSFIEKDWSSFE